MKNQSKTKTVKGEWVIVPNTRVRSYWKCDECKEGSLITNDWYQENGIPMCGECSNDMQYVHTEVFQTV
jgi:formylmethanofuran dehydrogenase subunit E